MKKVFRSIAALLVVAVAACGGGDPNIDTAKLNLKNKDYQKAMEAVDAALQLNAENAYAYYYKGVVYAEWAKATASVGDRAPYWSSLNEAWKTAAAKYAAVTPPAKEVALMDLSRQSYWASEYNDAIKLAGVDAPTPEGLATAILHLKNAAAINPDSAMTFDILAEVYMMTSDTASAITTLRKATDVGGVSYNRALRLSGILGMQRNFDAKIEVLTTAKTKYPDSIGIVQEMANTYLAAQQTDKALDVVKQLIDKDPSNANYHLVYGTQVYQAVFDLSNEMRKDYDAIFELRRRLNKAKAAARNNPPPKPVKGKPAPVDSVAMISDMLAKVEGGIPAKKQKMREMDSITLAEMKVVAELDPTNHSAYHTMGIVYQNRAAMISAEINSLDALAKDYYDRADEMDAKAKDTLREGLPFYEKAAELKPDNKEYWNSLFKIYTSLNMMDKANEAYDKANG